MRIPQPRDGWRVFAGEVGVIVLGVLLALGAQQAVEAWQAQRDVRAFRETINREIGFNLFALGLVVRQEDCGRRKVDELRDWLASSRTGAPVRPIFPRGPYTSYPYWSAWQSRDADTYSKLDPVARQKYAMLYDLITLLNEMREGQSQEWGDLLRFSEPGSLSLDDRRSVARSIVILAGAQRGTLINIHSLQELAEELHIKPVHPQDLPPDDIRAGMRCRSIYEMPKF